MTIISDERLAEIVGAGVPCVPIEPWEVAHVVQELRSLRAQGGVRVKPLEWDELNDGKTFRALLPIIGSIRVEPYGVCGWWEVLWSMPGQCDKLVPDVFDTPEEAKAAAQADYERRILSALEASPAVDERDATNLLSVIADIREKTGVGAKPMLSELADAIAARIEASPAPAGYTAEDGLRRVREIALQSEAAPLSMGEIIKVVDMALAEKTPFPDWLTAGEASPAPVSEELAKPTVEQAIESLVSALDEMRSQQAKRDEFLATLIVNIEKNEPTAEFAVNLREYVRNGRAALAAKGGQ